MILEEEGGKTRSDGDPQERSLPEEEAEVAHLLASHSPAEAVENEEAIALERLGALDVAVALSEEVD